MPPDLNQRITELEEKIDKVFKSVEKVRRYFFWTMVITIAMFVIPAIGLIFAIPYFLNTYVGGIQSEMNLTQ